MLTLLLLAAPVAPFSPVLPTSPALPLARQHAAHAHESAHVPCGTELTAEDEVRILTQLAEGTALEPPGVPRRQFVVPLTVHVVRRSDGTGGIGPVGIANTIRDANELFAPGGIHFCQLGETVYIDDDDLFACVCGFDHSTLRTMERVEGTVNVYFVKTLASNGSALCGLATLPGQANSGVVMRNSCTAAGGNRSTFAHELGHFLDLLHTHETYFGTECTDGSNCAWAGDMVCDTPADPNLYAQVNFSCQYVGPTAAACPEGGPPYSPPIDNVMSYARSSCRSTFTEGQFQRMRGTLLTSRADMARTECPHLEFPKPEDLVRISVTAQGEEPNTDTRTVALSRDGKVVAYSNFEGLVDTTGGVIIGASQVYLRTVNATGPEPLQVGPAELVSRNAAGEPSNGNCDEISLSGDGRYVVFSAGANNLLPEANAVPATGNVYRLDRRTGELELVSRAPDGGGTNVWGTVPNAVSDDGRYIAYSSRATNLLPVGDSLIERVYLADMRTGEQILVSGLPDGTPANGRSYTPTISADGSRVAFTSSATNLDPADDDGVADVYVWDRETRSTRLVSIRPDGVKPIGSSYDPVLSADGRTLAWRWTAANAWPDDPTGITVGDIAVADLETGELRRASEAADGSPTVQDSGSPSLSADGRRVAFVSAANELEVPPSVVIDRDVWVKDLHTGELWLASRGGAGDSIGPAVQAVLDGTGEVVAFRSASPNLVPDDDNRVIDAFVARRQRDGRQRSLQAAR